MFKVVDGFDFGFESVVPIEVFEPFERTNLAGFGVLDFEHVPLPTLYSPSSELLAARRW